MSDMFGGIELPVVLAPDAKDDAVTDPTLDKLASFLTAILNATLGPAWSLVNPGKKFVEQYFTVAPGDSEFNERDLPALFLWRNQSLDEQYSDDLLRTRTDVTALWIPQNAVQSLRALRDPALNGFQKAISSALYLGRVPAWVDPTDPDVSSASLGSALMLRAGLSHWPYCTIARRTPVAITVGDAQATYAAFSLTINISEVTVWDPNPASIDPQSTASPSKVDINSSSGALTLESKVPTT